MVEIADSVREVAATEDSFKRPVLISPRKFLMPIRLSLLLIFLASMSLSHPLHAQRSGERRRGNGGSNQGGVLRNSSLPDVDALTADGKPVNLRELCDGKYTLLAMGCLTCPEFHRSYPEIEAANQDYASDDVQFFYVYKSLRHPELGGYVEAQNQNERLLQLKEAREILGTQVPWLADSIDNSIRDALQSGSRSVYLVSPEGKIVFSHNKPTRSDIREALSQFVGEIEQPTLASELDLPQLPRRRQNLNVDSEIRVARPEGLTILAQTAKTPEQTYYVKLRAEADAELLQTGTGKLFLGFYPDPIHNVHWNNLTEPMNYTLTLPEGVEATPMEASANKGPGDKDTKPRQFWVTVKSDGPLSAIELSMHYFGCTEGMCEALTQEYTIEFKEAGMDSRTFGFNRGPRGRARQELLSN